ncbi:uncharacterized protein LOC119675664 [Teleopsis dalmanni]|uniref:uncharacterized protein LOC119675664 n=1 Tax=Teleopsis dalmanni TaxID=139649 RepID=UPI0018CD6063|nr:uncharacterized protein LOC119675664 [Teleopsis dalmanni]
MHSVIVLLVVLFALSAKVTSETEFSIGTNLNNFTTRGITTLRPIVERVFSRKKRFLILPKGSSFKCTIQVSKRLLAQYPRGLNFIYEAATYYPAPASREDLLPKRFKKPTTPKPKGKPQNILVCIPGSTVCYKGKPAAKPKPLGGIHFNKPVPVKPQAVIFNKHNSWDQYSSPNYVHSYKWAPSHHQYYSWQPPSPSPSWSRWSTQSPTKKWWKDSPSSKDSWSRWDTHSPAKKWWNSPTSAPHSWSSWSTQSPEKKWWNSDVNNKYDKWKTNKWSTNHNRRWERDMESSELGNFHEPYIDAETSFDAVPTHFSDLEPFEDWKHFHTHRDRRQLFHHFEGFSKILGIDMKSCIMRAICDSKLLLLPPGYSMIHDILRVVFNFPTISGLTDDYSRTMQSDFDTCDKNLRELCPFNLLEMLMKPAKGS